MPVCAFVNVDFVLDVCVESVDARILRVRYPHVVSGVDELDGFGREGWHEVWALASRDVFVGCSVYGLSEDLFCYVWVSVRIWKR